MISAALEARPPLSTRRADALGLLAERFASRDFCGNPRLPQENAYSSPKISIDRSSIVPGISSEFLVSLLNGCDSADTVRLYSI